MKCKECGRDMDHQSLTNICLTCDPDQLVMRSQGNGAGTPLGLSIKSGPAGIHDPVNHPSHYTSHPSGVECIDVTEHMNFNRGSAIKYIWRAGMKDDIIQDLKKAEFYVKREIARIEKLRSNPVNKV